MSTLRIFNFCSNKILGCSNVLATRNSVCYIIERHASLSVKTYEKLGIPTAPKKPLSPYLRFAKIIRPKILQNQPNLQPIEVIKIVASEWNKYDPEQKIILQNQYESDKQIYLSEFEKYKLSLTPEQQRLIQEAKERVKKSKEQADFRTKIVSLGKPKKPLSAFLKYLQEKGVTRNTELKYSDWVKQMSKQWENISSSEKEKYFAESKKEFEQYKKDILAWEEDMIKQGHLDVIRNRDILENKKSSRKQ